MQILHVTHPNKHLMFKVKICSLFSLFQLDIFCECGFDAFRIWSIFCPTWSLVEMIFVRMSAFLRQIFAWIMSRFRNYLSLRAVTCLYSELPPFMLVTSQKFNGFLRRELRCSLLMDWSRLEAPWFLAVSALQMYDFIMIVFILLSVYKLTFKM